MRRRKSLSVPLVALVLVLLDWILVYALFGSRVARAVEAPETQTQLREALSKLAPVQTYESFQKEIFEKEVLPQPSRFIRDYRNQGQGLQVDVDNESLARYLAFHAPKTLKSRDYKVLTFLQIDPNCAPCVRAQEALRASLTDRLTRRGLTPVWATNEPTARAGWENRLIEQARGRQMAGAFILTAERAAADDEDAAHADEVRIWVNLITSVRELSVRTQGRLELMEKDSVDSAFQRLWADAFTEIGSKAESIAVAAVQGSQSGVLLEVSRFADYQSYTSIVEKLTQILGSQPIERRMTQGRVWLLVTQKASASDVRRMIETSGLKNFVEVKQ